LGCGNRRLSVIKARCEVRYDLDDEEAGQTTRIAGRHCIVVNGRHSLERQRFTILHESAHIELELPSVHGQRIETSALLSYTGRPQEEILCDVFAAECLLPSDFLKRDVDRCPVGFDSIASLAARYEASLTSTGSRFALLHEEPCAFVLAEAGLIRYVSSSKLMREWGCWIKIGMPIPPGSVAQKVRAGHIVNGPVEVDPGLWLESQRYRGTVLLEEARFLSQWDQVLSLLWFETNDDDLGYDEFEDMDDDRYGLKELDGILPWPSKKRRR